jgi:hypothetical protein
MDLMALLKARQEAAVATDSAPKNGQAIPDSVRPDFFKR